MKEKLKRSLGLLLALVMVASMFPVSVFAEEAEPISTEDVSVIVADEEASVVEQVTSFVSNVIGPLQLEEETAEEEPEPLTATYKSLVDGNEYQVTLTYSADAKIPANARLSVNEIFPGTEAYAEYVAATEDALGEGATVTEAVVLDISIIADEQEVEPAAPVNVEITLLGQGAEDWNVVHFSESEPESPQVMETNTDGEDLTFATESFSVFVMAKTSIEETYLASDGNTYRITVTYDDAAGIPDGSVLVVREILPGTPEFFSYYNDTIAALGFSRIIADEITMEATIIPVTEIIPEVPVARYFDISIWNDGNKVEPQTDVEVKISYDDPLSIAAGQEVAAVHFANEEKIDINPATAEENTVTFSQDGFSVTGTIVVPEDALVEDRFEGEANSTASFSAVTVASDAISLLAASDNQGPATSKTVTDNGDGTFKIKLDIVGRHETHTEITKANVVVVFDRSGSMTAQRMSAAKSAVNNVASMLLGKNNPDHQAGTDDDDIIEMALVSFSNSATIAQQPTTSVNTFSGAVNGLTASGGTNWEDALQECASVSFGDDDPTYVIFVSDGNPTFRNSRITTDYLPRNDNPNWSNSDWNTYRTDDIFYGGYYNYRVYGLGSDDPTRDNYSPTSMQRCYDAALDDAKNLVNSGRILYTIGAYGDVSRMQSLTTESGAGDGHYYAANDDASLQNALREIADAISSSMGFENVQTTDGVPALSDLNAKVSGAASGFKYYKNGVEWTGAPEARFDEATSAVIWDLSDVGELENATYSIEFDVWPSQEAYDLIADLNNGLKSYDSLSSDVKAQITKHPDGTYTLKTNTFLTTSYTTTDGQTGSDEWDYEEKAMALPAETIGIKKIWNNILDQQNPPAGVELVMTKDGINYLYGENAIQVTGPNWSKDDIFISVGQMRTEDGELKILEAGHDYQIVESQDYEGDWRWELTSEVYHPMVINGVTTILIQDDSGTYEIGGKKYKAVDSTGEENSLQAWNDRRSWLQLEKKVTGTGAPEDAEFDFTATIVDKNGDAIWYSAYGPDGIIKDTEWTNGTPEEGNTGYFYAPSGSEITFTIKAGWTIRFLNLPSGTTYTIVENEATLPVGFAFDQAEDRQVIDADPGVEQDDPEKATINGSTVTGKINVPNVEFYVDYTNKYELTKVTATKTWSDNNNQDGKRPTDATVQLYKTVNGTKTKVGDPVPVPYADNSATIHEWTNLPVYEGGKLITYSVEETLPENSGYGKSGDDVTLPAKKDDSGTVAITNTRETGSLTVTKVLKSDLAADADVEFEITVTLDVKTISGTFGGMTFTDGVATFKLKGGQNVTATGLPTLTGYTVTEKAADGFTITYSNEEGTITTTAATATVTNTRETSDEHA